jgi:hypothetical protein
MTKQFIRLACVADTPHPDDTHGRSPFLAGDRYYVEVGIAVALYAERRFELIDGCEDTIGIDFDAIHDELFTARANADARRKWAEDDARERAEAELAEDQRAADAAAKARADEAVAERDAVIDTLPRPQE